MNPLYKTKTMLAALAIMYRPQTFLRDTFFRNEKPFNTASVEIDVRKGKRRVAVYTGRADQGRLTERTGFVTYNYKTPYIKEKRLLTPGDLLDRMPGETVYTAETPADRAQRMLGQDLFELDEMITRREEIQCAQALFDGEIIFRDANEKVTFPISASHQISSLSAPWDVNGKPIDDLREWRQLIIKDSGRAPDICIMGSDACKAFLANDQIAGNQGGALSQVKVQRGEINPQNLIGGVTYWGYLPEVGVDIYSYDEWYIDPTDNTTELPIVPVDAVLLGSTQARMDRLYGVIEDMSALYAVPRFPKAWKRRIRAASP